MAHPLFNEIVTAVIDHDPFFRTNIDCTRKEGISGLLKCTSSICQLAYGVHAEFLDEYMQISEKTSCTALDHFCQAVMHIYGPEFLRKPTVADVENSTCITKKSTGFRGSLEIPFVDNDVTYRSGYYLVDGIYPKLAPLVKTIPEPTDDDHKRILYKQKQESARKDVERAFGVCKKKWAILDNPTRALRKDRIVNMMYTCIILHNMIRKYKKYAISSKWFSEEAHQPDDTFRNEEQVKQVMSWIRSSQAHQNLRHDLIEHLSRNA
ncbi:serine/threonine-protein kinase STY17-like protein [Tanacetum coccineum]